MRGKAATTLAGAMPVLSLKLMVSTPPVALALIFGLVAPVKLKDRRP